MSTASLPLLINGYEKLFGPSSAIAALRLFLEKFPEPCSRKTLAGHVTGSALVMDRGTGLALRVYHPKLACWVFSAGGHIDSGETPWDAATRELREEVGIKAQLIAPQVQGTPLPLSLAAHAIPASAAKGEPAHWHYDLVYLFETDSLPTVTADPREVGEYQWAEVTAFDKPAYPVCLAEQLAIFKNAIGAKKINYV